MSSYLITFIDIQDHEQAPCQLAASPQKRQNMPAINRIHQPKRGGQDTLDMQGFSFAEAFRFPTYGTNGAT
jgi:hypothetical protein